MKAFPLAFCGHSFKFTDHSYLDTFFCGRYLPLLILSQAINNVFYDYFSTNLLVFKRSLNYFSYNIKLKKCTSIVLGILRSRSLFLCAWVGVTHAHACIHRMVDVCACVQVTGQMVVRLGISPKASNHINERTAITIRSAVLLQLYLFTFLFTSTIQAMKLNMLIFSKKLNALLLVSRWFSNKKLIALFLRRKFWTFKSCRIFGTCRFLFLAT